MRPIVPDNPAKFRDPRLNLYGEISPEPSDAAFSTVSFQDNFRPENDVVSGVVVKRISLKISVKFGDST